MDDLPAFLLANLALAGSPGPGTLSLAASGAAFGARAGVAYMVGIDVGMAAVIGITASGIIGLLLALPGATPIITAVAAAYFLYLAYRIATAPPLRDGASDARHPSFAAGVLLSLVNPKAYAAMAAMFSSFTLVREGIGADIAAKFIVLMTVIVAVNVAWLLAGASLTRVMREPRTSRAINIAFAIALIVSTVFALAL